MQSDDVMGGTGSRRAARTGTAGPSAQPQLPPACQTQVRNPIFDFFLPRGGTDLTMTLLRPCTLVTAVSFTCPVKGPPHGAAQPPPHPPPLRDPQPPPAAEAASRAPPDELGPSTGFTGHSLGFGACM